jgi:hypothetical protein
MVEEHSFIGFFSTHRLLVQPVRNQKDTLISEEKYTPDDRGI